MTFDFIARKFAQPVPEPKIDFSCKVCGVQCDTAPLDGSGAICPDHCQDHQYFYEPGDDMLYSHHEHLSASAPGTIFDPAQIRFGI